MLIKSCKNNNSSITGEFASWNPNWPQVEIILKLLLLGLFTQVYLDFVIIWTSLFCFLINIISPVSTFIMTPGLDIIRLTIIILSRWILPLLLLSNPAQSRSGTKGIVLKLLSAALFLRFSTSSFIEFYFFFECRVIPIFLVIVGWGYQPERFSAGLFLLFYTLFASLPMLAILVKLFNESGWAIVRVKTISTPSSLIAIILSAGFLVKLPIYGVHLWLPKAHVEAPVSGRIILAGVLLKLGGYGIIRVSIFISSSSILSVSILGAAGGAILGILNCQISDIKVLIAYSSVVHIAIIVLGVVSLRKFGLEGAVWIIVAHGLISSAIFSAANIFYERSHSRSLIINKGVISWAPLITTAWFLLIIFNFGGPFTLNLFSEIGLIYCIVEVSYFSSIFIAIISFFSAGYRLVLYSRVVQGQPAKWGGRESATSLRESTVLYVHIW